MPYHDKLDDNEADPIVLWAVIHELQAKIKGPGEFETWADAALSEKLRRLEAEKQLKSVNTFVSRGDPTDPKSGDMFPVRIGDKWFQSVIDEQGVQRFKTNGPVNALINHQQRMFDQHWMKDRIPNHPAVYGLNEIAVDFIHGNWSREEMIEFYTMFGYSVSGLVGMSFVEDVPVYNPLWFE